MKASKTKAAKKARASVSPALRAAIEKEFTTGKKIPAIAKTKKTSVHLVAPIVWAFEARALGTIAPTPAAILAARKSGQRREIVALRASVSVAKVREIETAKNRRPIYTGRGTKKHLAVA